MYLLRLKDLIVDDATLEEAVGEVYRAAKKRRRKVPLAKNEDEAHLLKQVVQELIVFATYASTIPANPPALFIRFLATYPFFAVLNPSVEIFTRFAVDYFKENYWRFRADTFRMPVVGEHEMIVRYEKLENYINDFKIFISE